MPEEPGRFRIDEAVEPGKVRTYESPDLPCEGRYVLFVKQGDSVLLFPLTQKIIFRQTFESTVDADAAYKNTLLLMKNRKVKAAKAKVEDKDKAKDKDKDGSEGRFASSRQSRRPGQRVQRK